MNGNRPPAAPYPINAFHNLISDACNEVLFHIKAPDAVCGMSFLSVMAMACQAGFDVETPVGQRKPLSLYTMTIAEPGDRKTPVDNLVMAPFHERQEHLDAAHDAAMGRFESEARAWKHLTADIKRRLAKQYRDDAEGYSLALEAHLASEPVPPIQRRLLREDLTAETLFDALSGNGQSLAIVTDEGDVVFRSRAMANLGVLNRIYDGARSIPRDRVAAGPRVIRNPRMSISIMTQPKVLDDYLERKGDLARGSGHLARYLVGMPESTKGLRAIWWGMTPSLACLEVFHERVNQMLDAQEKRRDAGCHERELIRFSEDAKREWIRVHNSVEEMLLPWGWMRQIPDFASKSLEMIARVAAILHCFTCQDGDISVDTLQRALAIMNWHLFEFHRIFCPPPQSRNDAHTLYCYLQSHYWNYGMRSALRNELLRNGPIRPRENFEPALHQLQATGHVFLRIDEKSKRRIVDLNPSAFQALVNQ